MQDVLKPTPEGLLTNKNGKEFVRVARRTKLTIRREKFNLPAGSPKRNSPARCSIEGSKIVANSPFSGFGGSTGIASAAITASDAPSKQNIRKNGPTLYEGSRFVPRPRFYKEVARDPSPKNDAACQTADEEAIEKKDESHLVYLRDAEK